LAYTDDYSRLVARHYDAIYGALRNPVGDVAFYRELARESGGPLLELGCGTGRTLLPIARDGIACVGLDASPEMLAALREKAPPQNLELVHGRMESFDLAGRRFRLITAPFRAFSHLLDVEAQLAALACIRRHLAPGGRFAFDVFDPNLERTAIAEEPEVLVATFNTPAGRVARYDSVRRDHARQVLTLGVRFDGDAAEDSGSAQLQLRWFHKFELEHLLARAGFTIEAWFGSFDRRPWEPSSDSIVIARIGDVR
jgi:SAM-dependent methyltransferase